MSSQRTRIDAATAEHLLGGGTAGHEHHLVAMVLSAAAGPAQPHELAGRAAAIAGFRAARLEPTTPTGRSSMIQTVLVKLLTVKAAAVAAVVLGTGGVAVAAGAGTLPNPIHPRPDRGSGTVGTAPDKPSNAQHKPTGSTSPSLVGLCHAYLAKGAPERGKSLESPAFRALVTAAHGKDKVQPYCATLLATASESARSGGPKPDQNGNDPAGRQGGRTDKPNQGQNQEQNQEQNQGQNQEQNKESSPNGGHTDHPTGKASKSAG